MGLVSRLKGSAALAALLSLAAPAVACFACIQMPAESLAEKVSAAEVVALLRPSPDDPFRFEPVGFLKGGEVADRFPSL